MTTKKDIENAVSTYFKVATKDLYEGKHHVYPYDGARRVLAYMLYDNGVKIYDIEEAFSISNRQAFRMVAEVQVALKSDTKIKEDVESINKMLNQ